MSKKKGDYSRGQPGPIYNRFSKGYQGEGKHKKDRNLFNTGKTYEVDRVVKVLSTPGEPYINPDKKKKKEEKLEKKVKNDKRE